MIASAKDKPVQVRFPDRKLIKRLDVAARRNGRSRNTEILVRLLASFNRGIADNGSGRPA